MRSADCPVLALYLSWSVEINVNRCETVLTIAYCIETAAVQPFVPIELNQMRLNVE